MSVYIKFWFLNIIIILYLLLFLLTNLAGKFIYCDSQELNWKRNEEKSTGESRLHIYTRIFYIDKILQNYLSENKNRFIIPLFLVTQNTSVVKSINNFNQKLSESYRWTLIYCLLNYEIPQTLWIMIIPHVVIRHPINKFVFSFRNTYIVEIRWRKNNTRENLLEYNNIAHRYIRVLLLIYTYGTVWVDVVRSKRCNNFQTNRLRVRECHDKAFTAFIFFLFGLVYIYIHIIMGVRNQFRVTICNLLGNKFNKNGILMGSLKHLVTRKYHYCIGILLLLLLFVFIEIPYTVIKYNTLCAPSLKQQITSEINGGWNIK